MASQDDFEKRTYNYLRLAMIGMLIMLTVAVWREHWRTASNCWQGSISAYYYTPVHAVFIGSLVTIGICMIVLKGQTTLKDVLLNLGGLLAPVVAFVPTPTASGCSSQDIIARKAEADVANNMVAYFAVGGVALLASAIIGRTSKGREKWDWKQIAGLVTSVVLWLAGIMWFAFWRTSFVGKAHYTAAALLFAIFIVIVFLSTKGQRHLPAKRASERKAFTGFYAGIAVGMCVCLAIGLIWRSSILVIETLLLVFFALYWALRTAEQWRAGGDGDPEEPAELTKS